jgi:methionine biosynthesis protein MetW
MRADLEIVAALVPAGSRVLDLGCGPGDLLERLAEQGCRGTGVEIDGDAFLSSVARGVAVLSLDIDSQLDAFADDSYDVVVLSQTLQATRRPRYVLAEIARIAPRCVLTVPNFAYWRHRSELLLSGRMPVSAELPYPWYQTPNIHLSTLPDTEALVREVGLRVQRRTLLDEQHTPLRRQALASNLRAARAVYTLSRAPRASG